MERILVIDDDVELSELLTEYLGREGFVVDCAHAGDTGLKKALSGDYSLIVLDIMLPVLNGFGVLQAIRRQLTTPVIMLTARGNDVDRVVGLEMGSDDYLSKPFNARELLARIRAVLRRSGQNRQDFITPDAPARLRIGEIEMDPGARVVSRCGEPIDLTSVEFCLLEMLMRKAGQLVSREDLMQSVLNRALSPYDRSIDVHISKLRKKLGSDISGMERIKTVRGVGYLYVISSASDGSDA
jgi:two-component system, OmpR family, response regulator CpxR